jgi:LmbE family N-acetylglucosaminyl deacetylase
MPTLATLGRTLVVSPHLDDAVFSCGRLLSAYPGATVVTVFAGLPDEDLPLTDWDERCGFSGGRQAMAVRREEDAQALTLLEARPVWLDLLDAQYRSPTRTSSSFAVAPAEVARGLQALLPEVDPQTLLFPLGLFHADHEAVHMACRLLWPTLRARGDLVVLAYEDALYRGMPGRVQQRLMDLAQAGLQATPARFAREGSSTMKALAVKCYASQLQGFGEGGHDDLDAPERCWRLTSAELEGTP